MRQGFSIYTSFAFRYSSWKKKINLICFTCTSFYKVPGDPNEVHLACHSDMDPRDSTSSHTQLKPNCVIWYEMLHPHGSRLPPLLSVNLSHAPPCSQSFSFYRFSAPALRWPKKIPASNIKTDYQHHYPRKVPSISTQIQHDSVIFYILGSFSQDTHNNLEPASQSLILSICFHCSLRRLLVCLHVNMYLVFSLKTTSPVMGWNGIGSTVGKWKEKSGPYRLGRSSLHSPKWYQSYNKDCSIINLIQSLFTLASWREEWHI